MVRPIRKIPLLLGLLLIAVAVFAAPEPSARWPNVLLTPQISNPPIIFQNAGTSLGVFFTVNCSTGMSCSNVGGVFTMTATGSATGTVTSIATTSPITGGTITTTGTIACATCVTSAGALTSNAVVIGGGLQASSTISADTTTTHALFATAGAPAFRALAAGDIPTAIPIANIGSAGLSGTSPATISATGAIGCATCVVASSPGAGLAHFAGSTQTVTSSAVTSADATGNTSGSGNFCLVTSCTMVTPTLGAATATSVATGTSPPTCTIGTAGTLCMNEGTAPTAASSVDDIYADSTAHCVTLINQTANIGCAVGALRAVMTADWSCGTGGTVSSCVSATIVGSTGVPLTITLPSAALSYDWDCDLVVGQATGATANNWNMLTATNGATNVTVYYTQGDSATTFAAGATTDQGSTTTTFNIGGTWTLGGTGTKMPVHIHGRIEGASASGTVVSLQLVAPTVGDLVTIYRGASCWAH